MNDTLKLNLELNRDTIQKIVSRVEDHDLYAAIIAAQAGEPLEQCLITEWSQHWPVVDAELRLTGEVTNGEDSTGDWLNYNDAAMISRADAEAGDWDVDSPDTGYAQPND